MRTVTARVHTHRCIYPGCTARVECTGAPEFVDPGFVCRYDLEEGLLCGDHIDLPEPACQLCGLTTGEVLHYLEDDEFFHADCKAWLSPACDGASVVWVMVMGAAALALLAAFLIF